MVTTRRMTGEASPPAPRGGRSGDRKSRRGQKTHSTSPSATYVTKTRGNSIPRPELVPPPPLTYKEVLLGRPLDPHNPESEFMQDASQRQSQQHVSNRSSASPPRATTTTELAAPFSDAQTHALHVQSSLKSDKRPRPVDTKAFTDQAQTEHKPKRRRSPSSSSRRRHRQQRHSSSARDKVPTPPVEASRQDPKATPKARDEVPRCAQRPRLSLGKERDEVPEPSPEVPRRHRHEASMSPDETWQHGLAAGRVGNKVPRPKDEVPSRGGDNFPKLPAE